MPLYEYPCRACDHHFELLVRESTKLECPKCAGTELGKQLSVFAVSAPASGGPSRMAGPAAVRRLRRSARRRQLLELRSCGYQLRLESDGFSRRQLSPSLSLRCRAYSDR